MDEGVVFEATILAVVSATDAVLDVACAWLCQQRRDWPAAAEV